MTIRIIDITVHKKLGNKMHKECKSRINVELTLINSKQFKRKNKREINSSITLSFLFLFILVFVRKFIKFYKYVLIRII